MFKAKNCILSFFIATPAHLKDSVAQSLVRERRKANAPVKSIKKKAQKDKEEEDEEDEEDEDEEQKDEEEEEEEEEEQKEKPMVIICIPY